MSRLAYGGAFALLSGALAAAGCTLEPSETVMDSPPQPVSVMSYNLANSSGERAMTIAGHVDETAPDFLAAQECSPCDDFVGLLDPVYVLARDARAGVALIYDDERWRQEQSGIIELGDNDDGWGERIAMWVLFRDRGTAQTQLVYSTHWCVTIRSDDDACDVDRQLDYAAAVIDHLDDASATGHPAVVAGDFNVFDEFEDGPVVEYLIGSDLVDTYRALEPTGEVITFQGNSWAPAGRIDYVFTSAPVEVLDSTIERDAVESGNGSDHYAVTATVLFDDRGLDNSNDL